MTLKTIYIGETTMDSPLFKAQAKTFQVSVVGTYANSLFRTILYLVNSERLTLELGSLKSF